MNNYNNSVRNNQAFSQESLNIVYWLGGTVPATFIPTPLSYVFTNLRLRIIKCLLGNIIHYKSSYISHDTIARQVGCSRNAVLDALHLFEDMGLFGVIHRGKQRLSNIYELGSLFKDCNIVWRMKDVLSGLYVALTRTIDRLAFKYGLINRMSTKNQDSTLYNNIIVLKKKNSDSSYCKISEPTTFKEKKLPTIPFMSKEAWLNMKTALWADWDLTEQDFYMDKYEYNKFYSESDISSEEIESKKKIQSVRTRENLYKYPSYYKTSLEKLRGPIKPVMVTDIINHEERLRHAMTIDDLSKRIVYLESLLLSCPRASIPFVKNQIQKYKNKANDAIVF